METTEDKNVVGVGFLMSGFNFATPSQEQHQPLQPPYHRSHPDSNSIQGKYAKIKIVIFLEQAKQSLYC